MGRREEPRDISRWWVGWGIFALAMAVRAAWVLYQWKLNGPRLKYDDEALHVDLAMRLAAEGTLVTGNGVYASRMPLYPAFLACFVGWGDWGILAARLAQAAIGGGTAFVGYVFARSALGRWAGIAAGVLIALDPFSVFFANLLLSEALFTLIAVWLGYSLWGLTRDTRRSVPILTVGLLGAAAVMTRQSAIGWVMVSWIIVYVARRRSSDGPSPATRGRRGGLCAVGVCALVLGLALLPWGIRNKMRIGGFAWLSTNGGITLYDGQGPQADGGSNQSFVSALPQVAMLGEVERDREFERMAWREILENPARVVRLACVKFLRTWSITPNVSEYRSGGEAMVSAVWMVTVLAAAAVGLNRARRERVFLAAVLLPIAYFTVLHCVYVGSVRYRVPLMPFVELLAAATIAQLPASGRDRDLRDGLPGTTQV